MPSLIEMPRRTAQTWIIFIKGLQVAASCEQAKANLLTHLTNRDLFSEDIVALFQNEEPERPYPILDSDPMPVAAIKKIMNAIGHIQRCLHQLETIPLEKNRSTLSIYNTVVKVSWDSVHELYAALQLINRSAPDIYAMIGPHLNALLSKMAIVSKQLQELTPSNPAILTGAVLSPQLAALPTKKEASQQGLQALSHLFVNLPSYFEKLNAIMQQASVNFSTQEKSGAKQTLLLQHVAQIEAQLNDMADASGLMVWPNYFKTCRALLAHTSTLINSAAPLTKSAYVESVALLNTLRHSLLPQFIAELETVEETLGLKTGIFSEPVLQKMRPYYQQCVDLVQKIAALSQAIDKTDHWAIHATRTIAGDFSPLKLGESIEPVVDIEIMDDDEHWRQVRNAQIERLSQLQLSDDKIHLDAAATRFFDTLSSYTALYQPLYKGRIAHLPLTVKRSLLADYKVFQTHLAARFPELDELLVHALTTTHDSTLLTKVVHLASIKDDYYKALWASNHFSQVMATRETVMTEIAQVDAQNTLKAGLIEHSMAHHERRFKNSTHLTGAVDLFMPSSLKSGSRLALTTQLNQLKRAKNACAQFFKVIQTRYPNEDSILNGKADSEKTLLLQWYQQFQPYLPMSALLPKDASLDLEIRKALCLTTTPESQLTLLHLNPLKETEGLIEDYIHRTELGLRECVQHEESLSEGAVLKPMGPEVIKKTLFGKLHELQLSSAIQTFIKKDLKLFLEKTVDPIILQSIDFNTHPLTEFHNDSPEALLYKKLLNSLYYIQDGLVKLEKLQGQDDLTHVLSKGRYVTDATMGLFNDFYRASRELQHLAMNPIFHTIVNAAMKVITPLKGFPVIGNAFAQDDHQDEVITTPMDIVDYWKSQQAIVDQNILGIRTVPPRVEEAIKPDTSKTIPPTTNASLLQEIATLLYEIPDAIEALNPKQTEQSMLPEDRKKRQENNKLQADKLLGGLKNLSYGAHSLKSILQTCKKVVHQIKQMGANSRNLAFDNLKEIRSQIGAEIAMAADQAEFTLGLIPGTISNPVCQQFDALYASFMTPLPIDNQTKLQLVIDTGRTEKRILEEEARLNSLLSQQTTIKEETLQKDSVDYEDLSGIEQLEWLIADKNCQPNPFIDFQNQIKFLRAYAKMEPYLDLIAMKYQRNWLMIELQTPDDFKETCKQILSVKSQVNSFFARPNDTLKEQINRSKNRLALLSEKLLAEKDEGHQQIEQFKASVFSDYLNGPIMKALQTELGPYANAFFKKIEPDFILASASILNETPFNITLSTFIEKKVDALMIDIRHENKELLDSYKTLNGKLNKINQLIEQESVLPHNQLRDEKITSLKETLSHLKILQQHPITTDLMIVQKQIDVAESMIIGLNVFDTLIQVDNELEAMARYVRQNPDSNSVINTAKMSAIGELKNTIMADGDPIQRMDTLKKMALKPEFKTTLLKNSDSFFTGLFKQFISFVFGWKSHEEKIYLNFNQRFFKSEPKAQTMHSESPPISPTGSTTSNSQNK